MERVQISDPTKLFRVNRLSGDASMDAASNFKSFVVALAASIGMASFVFSDDAVNESPNKCKQCQQCQSSAEPTAKCKEGVCFDGLVCEPGKCPTGMPGECTSDTLAKGPTMLDPPASNGGIAAFVSEWLSKSPKFSAEVAIHFGSPLSTETTRNVPSDGYVLDLSTGRFSIGGSVIRDLGVAGEFVLADRNFDFPYAQTDSNRTQCAVPHIAKPMRFTERIPRIQLAELVNDVIICGHRICSGNKCYEVKDEPVKGTACDKTEGAHIGENGQEETIEEPILVLPLAPPAPPGGDIALFENGMPETEAGSILRTSGLGNVKISLPVTTVVDLLVAKTELSTRLEMTSQLMDERQIAMQQIQTLANRNAALSTQLAVAEARNQMSEALTASVVERAELAIKLASVEPKSGKIHGSTNVVQTIQEDLSNIRRQIALLRRSPVPFAQSYVGTQAMQTYVPTAQIPVSQLSKDTETTCAGDVTESATTVK